MKLERCDEYNSDENISIILHKSVYLSGFAFNFIIGFIKAGPKHGADKRIMDRLPA